MKVELRFLLKSLADPDKPKPVRTWRRQSLAPPSGQLADRTSETP